MKDDPDGTTVRLVLPLPVVIVVLIGLVAKCVQWMLASL